jgi:methionyl-tRNA formyltransferase
MRVFFSGNGWLGWQVLRWLADEGFEIVGLALHPEARRSFGDELLSAVSGFTPAVFDASKLADADVLASVVALKPDIGVSVQCGYIFKPEFLNVFPSGCVNLHTAYLPFNRGAHPNVWALIDGTPAGVTLHQIDPGVDTGAILAQREVEAGPADTAASLYRKLERAGLELFTESWRPLVEGDLKPIPQEPGAGSGHKVRDLETLDVIDLDAPTTARRVINQLRARTFAPYSSAYFLHNGRKIFVRVELEDEGEVKP